MNPAFVGALDYELVSERAHALGITGRRLAAALAALRAFDADPAPTDPWDRVEAREPLIREAATRLWELLVQREACGFTQHDAVYEAFDPPLEVRSRV